WAAMGPTTLFGLGAGPGGLQAFCEHFAETFNGWWADLGDPTLDAETAKMLVDGLEDATGGRSVEALSEERDAMILGLLRALRDQGAKGT
ncbi:MAG: 3-hydroxyacyl-CoA dehydrogenase, partial [Pseudomonadota bacterium]